ncbi:MAG: MFS transporter [Pantoea sp.]|uniref:MFS transporter n=1 Tax=Pantoea phytobeneficialis TaxID=2052056 RepID=A0AAP9H600_9GAMM|nr:MFS transporter [Pantoea phytobeneficialis]MDO6410038.1 MFS transporter [Pantoea phytobeneficialis]QGR07191.1 MFS transporter [Pantoea phytobeneficialis]
MTEQPIAQPHVCVRAGRTRFLMLGLVFINIIINYMDRTNLSVAATTMAGELRFTPLEMGLIFSAFGWIYAALQIPGGFLIDRLGARLVYGVGLFVWSMVTALHAFAGSFLALFGLRLGVGAFEAPVMPANNRVISSWFPEQERASAIGIYSSAQFVGLACMTPLLFHVQDAFGWRGLFLITGVAGMIWALVWYVLYREPGDHKGVSQAELNYLRSNGALLGDRQSAQPPRARWQDLAQMFRSRKLVGIYIGQFTISATFWFFLTWFPTYLVEYRHMAFIKSGYVASLPYFAAFCGVLLAGFASDRMIRRGVSASVARKLPVILGLSLTLFILGANYTDNSALIILFMSVAFFGNGLATITWVFVTALAPRHLIGLAGGVFNFTGALSSIVVPIAIGALIDGDNFAPALAFIAMLAAIGIASYVFIVGKIDHVSAQ